MLCVTKYRSTNANNTQMSEPVYEKQQDPERGVSFFQIQSPQPGQVCYVQRTDEQGTAFYLQQVYQPLVYDAAGAPVFQVVDLPDEESDKAYSLHMGITVTSIFLPTMVYLIGFPFAFTKLRDLALARGLKTNVNIAQKMRRYSGFGWFSWFLHMAFLIIFTVAFFDPLYCINNCGPGSAQLTWLLIGLFAYLVSTCATLYFGVDLVKCIRNEGFTNFGGRSGIPVGSTLFQVGGTQNM